MNPVKELEKHGQAVWLDFLARGFIAKGELKRLVDEDGLKGVTSNPSIFEKAIGSSDEYDAPIGKALHKGDRHVQMCARITDCQTKLHRCVLPDPRIRSVGSLEQASVREAAMNGGSRWPRRVP